MEIYLSLIFKIMFFYVFQNVLFVRVNKLIEYIFELNFATV